MPNKYPTVVDNTMLSTYARCPKHYYWAHVRDLSPKKTSVHLHAGAAFAKGMETYRRVWCKTRDVFQARTQGLLALIKEYGFDAEREADEEWVKSAKGFEGLACAYIHASTFWSIDVDTMQPYVHEGKPMVECSFALPLGIDNPQTSEPVIMHGRYDMIAVLDGVLFVEDDKTATQLGAKWGQQWDLRSQFTGYCWGAKQYGFPVAGAIVRGTAILKTKISHAQAIVYRPQYQIDAWHKSVEDILHNLAYSFKYDHWPCTGMFNGACSHYSGCAFKQLCSVSQPDHWLDYYDIRVWDPTNPNEEDSDD